MSGNLYIVSTPIGNLDDITKRAIDTLNLVDIILCEDTRVTKKILNHYHIEKKLFVFNNINENRKSEGIIDIISAGSNIALVSDAGTPCISDPGYRLVNIAQKNNINVLTIPGPCSVTSALSISGLPTDNFFFQGFLPRKKGRHTKLGDLANLKCSIVLFESPKRILKTLNDIEKYFGNRYIAICRELTKIYEQVILDKVSNILLNQDNIKLKGEFVIIIAKEGYKN